ncbi:MAG: PKD domain-containing protein [Pirellulales bacterium]
MRFTDPDSADSHTQAWSVLADNGQLIPAGSGATFGFTPNNNGAYTVTYTVTDDDGGSHSDTVVVTVNNVAPTVDAVSNNGPVNESSPVTVTVSASDPGGANDPLTYDFDFNNDGVFEVSNTTGSAEHVYLDNGTYLVNVRVTDGDGGSGSHFGKERFVTVNNVAPTANAGADQIVDEGQSVSLAGSFTDPGWADTHTQAWSVLASNGQAIKVGSAASFAFTPKDDGTYTVTYTVTDDDGGSHSDTMVVTVNNVAPTVDAVSNNGPINESSPVTVTVSASDPGGANDPLTYEFDFDDDGTFEVGPQEDNFARYVFVDNGTYRVNVRVRDGDGGSHTGSEKVTVNNVAPMIHAIAQNGPVNEGSPVTITVSASDPAGASDPLTYDFDFDNDGVFELSNSTGSAQHVYTDNGTYSVNTRVTDGDGGSHLSKERFVTVNNVAPTAKAGADQTVNEGDTVTLAGNFTDPGTIDTHTQSWSVSASNGQTIANGSGASFSFVPNNNGSYNVTYTVTDDDGGSHSDTAVFTVSNVAPMSSVSGPSSGVRNQPLAFTLGAADLSPIDQTAGFVYAIDWESDGVIDETVAQADGHAVEHAFEAKGSYVVSVTATDVDGGTSIAATHTVTISAAAIDKGNLNAGGNKVKASRGSIILEFLDTAGAVVERLTFDDSAVTGSLIIYGSSGDDELLVDSEITLPVVLYGGDGDDVLQAGGGQNLLNGGEGDDTMIDTGGTNTLVGGTGSNSFVPGGGTNTFDAEAGASTADADAPQIIVSPQATGNEGTPIPLFIWAGLSDTDGSESLSVQVAGLPDAASLSAGQKNVDGSWTIITAGTAIDLSGVTVILPDDGRFALTVAAIAKEANGTTSTASGTIVAMVQNVAPTAGSITAPVDPLAGSTIIDVSAPFTDLGTADTHTAVWSWGDGSTSAGTVTETGGSGNVSGSHTYTAAGVYTLALTVTDDDGASHESTFQYVVVYDPSAGFVTGGGWITSPAGAYPDEPTLTGKANFGFNSQYKKGAAIPTGQTEFQFKVADLNFRSSSYEWLVVSGARAQYKGTGTINGAGNYGFMLTAIDGQINGGGGVDKFRIKIWDRATDTVVYDNQVGADDDAAPTTALGGGQIVIHRDSNSAAATKIEMKSVKAASSDLVVLDNGLTKLFGSLGQQRPNRRFKVYDLPAATPPAKSSAVVTRDGSDTQDWFFATLADDHRDALTSLRTDTAADELEFALTPR